MNTKIQTDKLLHALVSFALCTLLSALMPLWLAAVITLAIGVGKEVFDHFADGHEAELGDLLADLIGTAIAVVAMLALQVLQQL